MIDEKIGSLISNGEDRTVKPYLKRTFDRARRSVASQILQIQKVFLDQDHIGEAKRKVRLAIPFWLAGALTALAATAYSKAFYIAEKEAVHRIGETGLWAFLLIPVWFMLSWAVVEFIGPNANGSGIPQLMAAVEVSTKPKAGALLDRLLGGRVIVAKVLSSLASVLGGGAIGREGPTLQIAGSIFHLTGRYFGKNQISANHQGLLLAGGAAGLAAAFNTPLGGIAYVMEELSRTHISSFRSGILHAVIMAGIFAQITMGPYLYFGYPKLGHFEISNLGFVLAAAVASGLLAALLGQALKGLVIFRASLRKLTDRAAFAALCGCVFSVLVYFGPASTLGSGKELINRLLFEGSSASAADVLSRLFGTFVTYGAGGAGGIFAPTLSIGGAGASLLDSISGHHLGVMSVLVGMTAALAALTHSPLTSFILILEMTDRHSAIVPLMIAALVGQGVSKMISKTSFYEFVCHRLLGATEKPGAPRAD